MPVYRTKSIKGCKGGEQDGYFLRGKENETGNRRKIVSEEEETAGWKEKKGRTFVRLFWHSEHLPAYIIHLCRKTTERKEKGKRGKGGYRTLGGKAVTIG